MTHFNRRTFTLGGVNYSAPDPLSSATFARMKQEFTPILRGLGFNDEQIADTTEYLRGINMALQQVPYDSVLALLRSILRPESGVSVEEGYENASNEETNEVMSFFSESLKQLSGVGEESPKPSTDTKKVTRRRSQ